MQGQVKYFNTQRGYGFIVGEDEKDYFVHYSQIHYSQIQMEGFKVLSEGDIVSFEVETDKDSNSRAQVINVEPILTLEMVRKSLRDENLYVKPMKDAFGNNAWMVSDENNVLQSDERGMNFMELAAYAGFSISEE